MKGVHAALYWHAEKSVAYYAMNPIYYLSSYLKIGVLFPTLRSAQKFQTFLYLALRQPLYGGQGCYLCQ